MGDNFINHGQAGNMGHNSTSEGNTFVQNNNRQNEYEITSEDISRLKLLIDKLDSYTEDEIPKREATKASSYLYDLIEAIERKDEQEKEKVLSSWENFIGKVGEKTLSTLGIAADLVTLSMPLITMLGLAATSTG